ncbi:MAG: nitroreductase family protein [Dehalococcoidia bacterium]|nr:nitroreductase family protein [Dehalococcoidia bacterium]
MPEIIKVISGGIEYTKEDLMKMDPVLLRALLHERAHHNIEVPFYTTLLKWKGNPMPNFGQQAQIVFDVWQERGFTEDTPDIAWVKEYLAIAKKIRAGQKIEWTEPLPTPFTDEEMAVVNKLIYGRHSIRDWLDKPVPDDMIEKILEAGRAAPIGCNLDEVRFIVIREPEEAKMVTSDISTQNAVIIVICYDTRIPKVVGQDRSVPQNAGFDAAAAADHMLLMAHALGLGGVWLSENKTKAAAEKFKEQYGLPVYIEVALHIAVGWTAIGTIKSKRLPLTDMMIQRRGMCSDFGGKRI